jgi:hypothetical protein
VAIVLVVAGLAATPLWIDIGAVLPMLAAGQGESAAQAFSESTSRLAAAGRWHLTYLTPVGTVLAVLALIRRATTAGRTPWPVVSLWVLWGPVLALALAFATGFSEFPRHLLPSVPLLLYVMASEATALLESRPGRIVFVSSLALLCGPSLALDYRFAVDPRTASIATEDRWQYVTGWPAGYGLPEVNARLRAESRSRPLQVVSDTYWAPLSLGLEVYLRGADIGRTEVSGDPEAWAGEVPHLLASGRAVYFALEVESDAPAVPVLDLDGETTVASSFRVEKPEGQRVLQIFVVHGPVTDRTAGPPDDAPGPNEISEAVADARRGVGAARAGDHTDAAGWLWRAHRLEPGDLTIRYDLGVVLAAIRRKASTG